MKRNFMQSKIVKQLSIVNLQLSVANCTLLIVFCLFFSATAWGQTTSYMTIGTGTSYSTGSSGTFTPGSVMGNTYNYYAITQTIYTASEMDGAKTIKSVAFYHNAYSFTSNITIYLAHTSKSTISGSDAITSGDANYTGSSITVGGSSEGWQTFELNTPFNYNGTDNLLVVVVRSHSSGYKTAQGWRYTSTSSNYRHIVRSSDTNGYGTLSNGNSTYAYTQSYNRPNIQIGYTTAPYINLNPSSATVLTGFTQSLTASYGNVSGTPTITYTSSNTSVATVSGSGTSATVTAVAPGSATITATMNGSYTATCAITVEDPSYCEPGTGNYDGNGISNVTFGTNGVVVNNTVGGINYGDYRNLVGTVSAGATCQVDITYKTGYTYGTIIWVDWNQNYTFEGTEAIYAGTSASDNPTTLNATFPVPANTPAGDYRMRIIGSDMALDSYTGSLSAAANADPCGSYNYSTCHDYTLRVSSDPSIGLNPTSATVLTGFTQTLTATTANVTGTPSITYSTSNASVATVSGSGTTATVTAVAPGTCTITATMTYNNNTYTATCAITVEDPSYCEPGTGSYDGNGISNVTFGTSGVVNNTVGGINYGDYSNLVGVVSSGATCQVDITYKTGYTYGTIIWVDWNQNYTFEGTEAIYAGTSASDNPTTLNATFPVPANTPAGDYRMRIIGSDMALDSYTGSLSAAANADPCGSYNYSTCHDYTLRVSSDPSIGLNPTSATVFTGFTQALTASYANVTGTPSISYSSSNTSVATVSGSGTTATVTAVAPGSATITATMTYQGNNYTATCAITVEDPSYCTPAPSSVDNSGISNVAFKIGEESILSNATTMGSSVTYLDCTNKIVTVEPGTTVGVDITYNTGYTYGTGIWVDLDKDYELESSEVLYYGTSASSNGSVLAATITIPAATAPGDYRLRIGGADSGFDSQSDLDPCYTGTYACFQDYTLRVTSSCLAPTNVTVTNVTEHSVSLEWTPRGIATQWIIVWDREEYASTHPAWRNYITTTATSYTITDYDEVTDIEHTGSLTPGTEYRFRVFSDCEGLPNAPDVNATTESACPKPTNVTVSNLAPSRATVSWESNAGNYTVRYSTATVTGTTLDPIFEDGFENGLGSWTIYAMGYDDPVYNWIQYDGTIVDEGNHTGDYAAASRSWHGSNGDQSVDNWLVTPQMTLGDAVKFWVACNDGYRDSYAVYVSTGSNVVTSSSSIGDFVLVKSYAEATGTWTEIPVDISAYAGQQGYVAIRHTNYGGDHILVDDFGVYNTINTYSYEGWTTVSPNPTTESCQITGLSAETLYAVQVQANCGGSDGSSAWSTIYFTTPDNCGAPQELASSNITSTTAALAWADDKESYNLRYRKVYYYEDFESSDGIPAGWTTINNSSTAGSLNWQVMHMTNHSGNNSLSSGSYIYQNSGITPDNWLISPQLDLQGTLRVWLSGYPSAGDRYSEHFAIYISTSGNSVSNFTTTLVSETTTTDSYVEYTADLSSYAGQSGYIAIRHFNCSDQNYLCVDDFGLYGSENWVSLSPNPTTETANLTGLTPDTDYEWQVQGINCNGSGGLTSWSATSNFTTLCSIAASVSPDGAGSITGAGDYARGSSCTLTASANAGYNFVNWTENSTQASATATYSFTVAGCRTLYANFTPITYDITYDLAGGSVATPNPTSYTVETATFTLNNPTKEGYTFAGWTGTGLGSATTTVTIAQGSTGDRSYTATWTPINYTITYNLAGGSATNPTSYTIETATFTLNNPTKEGYTFAGWTGTDLGGATTTVTIAQGSTGNRSYTATWAENSYAVTFYNDGHGTIKVAGVTVANGGTASVNHFTTKTLAVTANTGYTFNGWTKTGSVNIGNTSNESTTITATATGGTVTATWVPTSYNISYNLDGGSVATDNPTNYTIETPSFTLVNPTKTGYTFAGWTGTGLGGATTTVTIAQGSTGNRSYTATWTINNYQIAVSANPSGSVSGGGNYNHFSECTVTASPSNNYCFKNWTEGGSVVSTDASYTFTVTGARTLVANFTHYLEVSDIATVDYCVTGAHAAVSATPAAGSGDYTYTWQKYNGSSWVAAPDAYNSDRYTPPYTTTGKVSYRVSVADNNGCAGHNSVVKEFDVEVSDVPSITALSAPAKCSGEELTILPTVNNNGKDVSSESYQISSDLSSWSSFANGSNVFVGQNGYYIKYTATNGCGSSSRTVQITVNSLPTASIDGPTSVCALKSETIVASGAGDGGSYSWSNDLGTGASKTVAITSNANYTVTVTDANGCMDDETISMTVKIPGNQPMTHVEHGAIWTGYVSNVWSNVNNWVYFDGNYRTLEGLSDTLNLILRTGDSDKCILNNPVISSPTFASNSGMIVRRPITIGEGTELNIDGDLNVESGSITLSSTGALLVTGNANIASGASVAFDNKDTLSIAGNLVLEGSLDFPESDTTPALRLGGNLVIDGGSIEEGGTLVFAGSSTQNVSNGASPLTLNNNVRMNMHRSRAGVPHTVFPDGTIFSKTTIFEYGIMDGNITFDGTGRAIVYGDYESYASGIVTKLGAGNNFTFPTGDDNVLGTITAKIRTGQSAVAKFHHKATGFTIEDGYPRWWNVADMCGADPFNHVSNFEYWDFNSTEALSGVMFRTKSATPEDHFHDPSEYPDPDNPDNLIQVAVYDGCWQNTGGELSITPDFTDITISGVGVEARSTRGGAITTLGSKSKSVVLPIELTSFTATCDGRSTLVEWSTATERNNDYFSLERSDDAINFTEIARVAGAGNSIEPLDYSYTDYGIHGGDNYYRLVQVDYDGTRTVSDIVVANCVDAVAGDPEVLAYPNPFNGELTLVLDNFDNRAATIEVYDMLGKLVFMQKADAPQNSYETILNLSNLPSGTYTVRVSTNDFVINKNVVKQ